MCINMHNKVVKTTQKKKSKTIKTNWYTETLKHHKNNIHEV